MYWKKHAAAKPDFPGHLLTVDIPWQLHDILITHAMTYCLPHNIPPAVILLFDPKSTRHQADSRGSPGHLDAIRLVV